MPREISEMSPIEIKKAIKDRKQWKADMSRRIFEDFVEKCEEALTKLEENIIKEFL